MYISLPRKYKKIYDFYKVLEENEYILLEELPYSKATIYRMIKQLNERYFCNIRVKDGRIIMNSKGNVALQFLLYDVIDITKEKINVILCYLLIKDFEKITRQEVIYYYGVKYGQVIEKQVDKWLKILQKLKWIKYVKVGKEKLYMLTEEGPFNNSKKNIYNDLQVANENCLELTKPDISSNINKDFKENIKKYIKKGEFIKIKTLKGNFLTIKPINLDYSKINNCWYLIYITQKGNKEIIRVKKELTIVDKSTNINIKNKKETLPKKIKVKVQFNNQFNIYEKVSYFNKLHSIGEIWEKDNKIYLRGEIEKSKHDYFLHWIRGFGCSALIIEPKSMIDNIVKSSEKVLKLYENEFGVKNNG